MAWDLKRNVREVGIVAALLCLVATVEAATGVEEQKTHEEVLAAARSMAESVRYCGLVTIDEAGRAAVRTMDPFLPEEDWTIWLATSRGTRKLSHIARDPRVTLYYFDPESPGYLTVFGKARMVDAEEERKRHWKEDWALFYENRNLGDDYVLIEVRPVKLEIVSVRDGIAGTPGSFESVVVTFPGRE